MSTIKVGVLLALLLSACSVVNSFSHDLFRRPFLATSNHGKHLKHELTFRPHPQRSTSTDTEAPTESSDPDNITVVGVVAPLKYMGPYACLALRFPMLSTKDGEEGKVLNFLLDTGANVNSIGLRHVEELDMPLLMSSKDLPLLGTAGVGGSFQPGDIFTLGDCQLDGLPPGQNFTFMTNLTAAGLPYPSPVGEGLLGLSFFLSFPAGVEFDWHGTDGDPPTMIFYYGKEIPPDVREGMTRLPLNRLPVQLLSLNVNVNGVEMPAMLDTGSPVTVLNPQAAKQAGIETVPESAEPLPQRKQELGDDVLTVGGVDGKPVLLYKSASPVQIGAGNVSFGEGPVYVGELAGLAVVGGLLDQSSPPAVVLGLDYLKRTYRMVLRVHDNEVWFEEFKKK